MSKVMLGDIIKDLKPRKPQVFLCNPNMETIGKLNESYNMQHSTRLADLNELSFTIPYMIDIRGELIKNPNVGKIRERFLIRVELGSEKEYYLITKVNDKSDSNGDVRDISAWSLGYQLRDKMIRSYMKIGIKAKEAMTDALSESDWNIGKNLSNESHYFNTLGQSGGAGGRTFDVSSKTVLDFVIEIAEAFNAVLVWDTVNKTVDFELPDNIGENKGLKISYGKYLQSLGRESNADEMVTRFTPYGRDEITIHSYNPTGTGYVEDFSFFMYPFQRDKNKKVISSSHYMSDSLCNAILDYKELVELNDDKFRTYLERKTDIQEELDIHGRQYFSLETDLLRIQDRIDAKKAHNTYYSFSVSDGETHTQIVNAENYHAVIAKPTASTIVFNGSSKAVTPNKWTLLGKINKGIDNVTIRPTGIVEVEIVDITSDEYNGGFVTTDVGGIEITSPISDDDILNKYSEPRKLEEMKVIEFQVAHLEVQMETVNSQITELQRILAVERNFTPAQIAERNQYIIEKEWKNDALTTSGDLYKEAIKEFEKIKEPQMVIEIDMVNLLKVVKEQRNWDKLKLGDTVTIHHERLGVNVTAKIIEITYDYEKGSISLKIANVNDIKDDKASLIKSLYGAVSTSTTVNMNKFKWDLVAKHDNDLNNLLTGEWDAVKNKIIAGTNESVEISKKGILITNPDEPNEYLIANHGVLAITDDNGKTWKHALTSKGLIGERIIGKILIGQNLLIENSSGTFKVDEEGVTVKGTSLRIIADDGAEDDIHGVIDDARTVAEKNAQKYADDLRELINGDIGDVEILVGSLNDYLHDAFHDGIIQEAEAVAIGKYINQLNTEKADTDSHYDSIYGNKYLRASGIKSALKTAKDNHDDKHLALINSINNAIAGGFTTADESADVDSKFSAYRTDLSKLRTALENAVNDIVHNKSLESEREDPYFEHGGTLYSTSHAGEDVAEYTSGVSVSGIGEKGGKVLEVSGNTSLFYRYAIPVDVNRTYKVRFRVKQTVNPSTGGSAVYAGVATLDANYNNITGGAGSHRYCAVSSKTITVTNGWQEFEGTITGVGDSVNQFRVGTAYVRPMMIVNYQNGNGKVQIDMLEFTDITETLQGKDAWGKFSGANNTLPQGNVEFNFAGSSSKGGNAKNTDAVGNQTASAVQSSTINFNNRNDRNGTTPRDPIIGADLSSSPVDAVQHTINTDGSADISFEWAYDESGNAGDIDGFIVYIMQASSSSTYSFGTSVNSEQVYYVTPEKRAMILYGVPANKYYTIGVRAYRIVDPDINSNEVIMSNIVKSLDKTENPYRPSSNVQFAGNISGTLNGEPVAKVVTDALNSLQIGTAYSNVTIDSTSGLVALRNDNKVRTILNATDGIKVQRNIGVNNWEDLFYADTTGQLFARGLQIKSDDGTSVMIDAKSKTIDFSKFTTIAGKLKADNITIGASSTYDSGYNPTTINTNLRNDLKLASALPTSITLDKDGITARANASTYARLDHRGLYIFGGGIQIDGGLPETQLPSGTVTKINNGNTAKNSIDTNKATWDKANTALQQATAYNGVKIDGQGLLVTSGSKTVKMNASDGLIIHNGSESVFYLDSSGNLNMKGNITMSGGSISWSSIGKPSYNASEVGALSDSSPRLTNITSTGVYTGEIVADKIKGGTIRGVSIDIDTDLRVGNKIILGEWFGGEKSVVFNDSTYLTTSGGGLSVYSLGWVTFDSKVIFRGGTEGATAIATFG